MDDKKSLLSQLPENGIMISIAGIGCYLIGYFYVKGYFERFGLPESMLDLQFSYYLTMGSFAILLSVLVLVTFFFFNEYSSESRIVCAGANIPFLLGAITLVLTVFISLEKNTFSGDPVHSVLACISILGAVILLIIYGFSIYNRAFVFRGFRITRKISSVIIHSSVYSCYFPKNSVYSLLKYPVFFQTR